MKVSTMVFAAALCNTAAEAMTLEADISLPGLSQIEPATLAEIAYVDMPDLPVLNRLGLKIVKILFDVDLDSSDYA